MVGTHVIDFSSLIEIGERIDADIREGRIASQTENIVRRGHNGKKKEGDISFVQTAGQSPMIPQTFNQSEGESRPIRNNSSKPGQRNWQQRDNRPWPNFGMTNAELYQQLLDARLLGPRPYKQPQQPYPTWYDPNVHCVYHIDAPGHSIENCITFRRNVLDLVDANRIQLKKSDGSTIRTNPLPAHEGQVNAIEGIEKPAADNEDLCAHLKAISIVPRDDGKIITVEKKPIEFIIKEPALKSNSNVVSFTITTPPQQNSVTIKVPAHFPYQSNRVVPWKYSGVIENSSRQVMEADASKETTTGVTRRGKSYLPPSLE